MIGRKSQSQVNLAARFVPTLTFKAPRALSSFYLHTRINIILLFLSAPLPLLCSFVFIIMYFFHERLVTWESLGKPVGP